MDVLEDSTAAEVVPSVDQAYTVLIDQEQFELLSQAMRYCVSFSLLELLVCSACLGAIVFGYLVRGWSRG